MRERTYNQTFHVSQPYPWWPADLSWRNVPAIPLERVQELGSAMLEALADYWLNAAAPKQAEKCGQLDQYRRALSGTLPTNVGTCMTRCTECIFLKEVRHALLPKRVCTILSATGFQSCYSDHGSRPQCVIVSEPTSFKDLLTTHIEWQLSKLNEELRAAMNWTDYFLGLAKITTFKPLHPTIIPKFKVGDDVVILLPRRGYVRGVLAQFDEGTGGVCAFVKHTSRSGKPTHTHLFVAHIMHLHDFEFLHANEKFARDWCKEQTEPSHQHSARLLRAGLKK